MAFTTLMLFQLFNVLNSRSDEQSAFVHAFRNGWLWTAIAGSFALQVMVVYLPFLQNAFGTTSLNISDWALCMAVASSVLWTREASKAFTRRKCEQPMGQRPHSLKHGANRFTVWHADGVGRGCVSGPGSSRNQRLVAWFGCARRL
jgi:hypothetical protein